MASYSTIRFNFAKAQEQANRLEAIADEMKRSATNTLDSSLAELSGGWKGDSANAYISKAHHVQSDIMATAQDLYAVAASIRKVSKKIYNAEMEAKRLAEEIARKSH